MIIAENCNLNVTKLKSGPLGVDQQIGVMIANFELDMLILYWNPMTPHPHDVDVKTLLRMAILHNVAVICNRSTADFLISSTLVDKNISINQFSITTSRHRQRK